MAAPGERGAENSACGPVLKGLGFPAAPQVPPNQRRL